MKGILRFYFRRVKKRRVRKKIVSKKYLEHKEKAREIALSRLEHFNKHYKLTFGKVFIRNQKSRWGSCSSKGNLNFNYKIALLPDYLADYLVVHELCHRKEFNHSQNFWDLVGETIPDYQKLQLELRKFKV